MTQDYDTHIAHEHNDAELCLNPRFPSHARTRTHVIMYDSSDAPRRPCEFAIRRLRRNWVCIALLLVVLIGAALATVSAHAKYEYTNGHTHPRMGIMD